MTAVVRHLKELDLAVVDAVSVQVVNGLRQSWRSGITGQEPVLFARVNNQNSARVVLGASTARVAQRLDS